MADVPGGRPADCAGRDRADAAGCNLPLSPLTGLPCLTQVARAFAALATGDDRRISSATACKRAADGGGGRWCHPRPVATLRQMPNTDI